MIPLGVVPYRDDEYSAKISGEESEVKRATILLRSLANYDRHHVNELVAEVVRNLAGTMAYQGWATFEILKNADAPPLYSLYPFTTKKLFKLPGFWLQIVPKAERERWKRSFGLIADRDTWLIEIPQSLGGPKKFRRILRQLRNFERASTPLVQLDLRRMGQSAYFDFSKYNRATGIYYRKATRQWGWNHRDASGSDWTEFAYFNRYINFRKSQAILREFIVTELNSLLRRLDIQAEIELSGLSSPEQLTSLRNEMLKGRATFKDVMDRA